MPPAQGAPRGAEETVGLPLEGGLLVMAHAKSRALWSVCRSVGMLRCPSEASQPLPSCWGRLNELGACYLEILCCSLSRAEWSGPVIWSSVLGS